MPAMRLTTCVRASLATCVRGCLVLILAASVARADQFLLRDGRTIAGPVRSETTAIAVQTLDGLVMITPDQVLVRDSDAELRASYRKLFTPARERGPGAMLPLMHWCEQKGLYPELLSVASALLAREPGHEAALKMLTELAHRDIVAVLMASGSTTSVTGRDVKDCVQIALDHGAAGQVIARELLRSLADAAKTSHLVKLLRDHRAPARELAARALGDSHPVNALEPLIATALFDRENNVRHASVAAVIAYHHPGAIYPFARGMSHARESVRMASLEAIEAMRDPRASGAVIANLGPVGADTGASRGYVSFGTQTPFVSDYDVEIAQGAAIAKPVIGVLQHGSMLDVKVIGAFASRSLTEQQATRRTLVAITGKDHGLDFAAWSAWWKQNRASIVAASDAPTENSR